MRPEHGRDKELLFKRISKTEWYRKKNLRSSEVNPE